MTGREAIFSLIRLPVMYGLRTSAPYNGPDAVLQIHDVQVEMANCSSLSVLPGDQGAGNEQM